MKYKHLMSHPETDVGSLKYQDWLIIMELKDSIKHFKKRYDVNIFNISKTIDQEFINNLENLLIEYKKEYEENYGSKI